MAPTSTSAKPATFRPEIRIKRQVTLVLAEQTAAIDPQRLGAHIGRLTVRDLQHVDAALSLEPCRYRVTR
jgi:mRNA interferase MazF